MSVVTHTNGDGFVASDDPGRVDLEVVHGFLTTAYWSLGVGRDVVARSVQGSLVMGVYAPDGSQVAFARAVTDRATFAWIADVFVVPGYRGRGLGRFVVESLVHHPELAGLRRMLLATADAHELYRSYGFTPLGYPDRFMERRPPPT